VTSQQILDVDAEMFYGILQQFYQQQWSGTLTVDGGLGSKTLKIFQGEISFASSSLLDDRLGEVLYRSGVLSLSKLTHYGALVSPHHRFGQVLLSLDSFDHLALWRALGLQLRHIVRSLFFSPILRVEINPGPYYEANIISHDESGEVFLASAYAYGKLLRWFLERIPAAAIIHVFPGKLDKPDGGNAGEHDTFLADFLSLAQHHPAIEELLAHSKLPVPYTYAVLLECLHQGTCKIIGLRPREAAIKPSLLPLKQQIQAYNLLLHSVQHHAGLEGKAPVLAPLFTLVGSFPVLAGMPRLLNSSGQVDGEGALILYCLGEVSSATLPALMKALRSLQCFLLQIAADLVSPLALSKIRDIFHQYAYR
jgi:hypothetical protein